MPYGVAVFDFGRTLVGQGTMAMILRQVSGRTA